MRLLAETEIENLHLLLRQLLVVVLDDEIDQSVGHQHVVKVLEVTLELVVERAVSETVKDFFAFLDRLVTEYDLFYFIVSLDQNVDILRVEQSVVRQKALELEEANLLDRLRGVKVEAVVDDLNGHAQVSFHGVFLTGGCSSSGLALRCTGLGCLFGSFNLVTFLSNQVTHGLEASQDGDGVLEALRLDLPVLFVADPVDLFGDVEDALSIVDRNRVQDVQTVNSDVDLRVAEADKRIVEEHIEPLLVECLLV